MISPDRPFSPYHSPFRVRSRPWPSDRIPHPTFYILSLDASRFRSQHSPRTLAYRYTHIRTTRRLSCTGTAYRRPTKTLRREDRGSRELGLAYIRLNDRFRYTVSALLVWLVSDRVERRRVQRSPLHTYTVLAQYAPIVSSHNDSEYPRSLMHTYCSLIQMYDARAEWPMDA